ncbi:YciI family protein [Microvirga subterranea]|uniref:YCII-related domain-containing protein n=1 Tax=Microvirga subterranea TaxID=186651 RepID=A0A370HUJ4_9HYPH|nr:YciI family protein [Microvirga subterranea]RDI61990.1 YCII-related domain-containing protein [Microvirga subterranea]
MPFHLCRLLPPRPTFPADITAEEAGLMQEHAVYWQRVADRGNALIVGPVLDPAGVWGVAIVEVSDAAAASALTEQDPVILSGRGFRYEIHPIPQAILRKNQQPDPL